MLKPYNMPVEWRAASVEDRLKALIKHYCTGPCGQSVTAGEIRSNTRSALKEAISKLADAERERDGLRGLIHYWLSISECACELISESDHKQRAGCFHCMLALALARPVTITRISHPESNARPADAGEESDA